MLNWEELDIEIALKLEEELVPGDDSCTELSAVLSAELVAPAPELEPEPPPQACSRLKHNSHEPSRPEIPGIFIAFVVILFPLSLCTDLLLFPRSKITAAVYQPQRLSIN